MLKLRILFAVIFISITFTNSYGQLAKTSWTFGFGFKYPRMINPNLTKTNENYGGFISIQRNFSEHIGLRLKTNYISIIGLSGTTEVKSIAATGNLDFIYYFVPCESISPFLNVGFGGYYATFENPIPATLEDQYDYEINMGFGVEWSLDTDWKLFTSLVYHTTNGTIDGSQGVSTGGLLGTRNDAYMDFDLGFIVYFGKGEQSKYCQIYDGLVNSELTDIVDYERIENIVKKYIPREVIKEVVVEKPVVSDLAVGKKWILIGVNFNFNSYHLRPEAYPVLLHAVQVLLQNTDMKIEIQGYTDNIGSARVNQQLSLKRAIAVKNYLVARGVSRERITTVGYGENNPVSDNRTAQGRELNRRIEFKIIQ
ncbi:MAG: OmpA family protein [Melioribacteraceae bacterium]|nr:OmpA family protein [Melioribacteraceae bacterium]